MGMLVAASRNNTVISVKVPELMMNLTVEEVALIHNMAVNIIPAGLNFRTGGTQRRKAHDTVDYQDTIGVSIVFETMSLGLHEKFESTYEGLPCSFVFKVEQFKAHISASGSSLEHCRFLFHDFHFCKSKSNAVELIYCDRTSNVFENVS